MQKKAGKGQLHVQGGKLGRHPGTCHKMQCTKNNSQGWDTQGTKARVCWALGQVNKNHPRQRFRHRSIQRDTCNNPMVQGRGNKGR